VSNSGNYNSGNKNTGNHNSGDFNSGNKNSGYYNSGNWNSGYCNLGSFNSGNNNSGSYNSGNYNSGNKNSGFFNTNEPTVRMFNKDTGLKREEINIPCIYLKLTDDKGNKINSYKEAWKLAWEKLDNKKKNEFLNLPNFCPIIFEEITGINVNEKETKTIIIDGKEIKISKESFEELKKQLT